MGGAGLPYIVQETHYTGPDTWHWLYVADWVAIVFLLVLLIVLNYQKKVTFSKLICLIFSVCAIVSVVYLALYLGIVADYAQAEPAASYVFYHIRYYALGVAVMLLWMLWRTLGGQWSGGWRKNVQQGILGGLIFWALFKNGWAVKHLEMLSYLRLYSYWHKADNLYISLFALLMFVENSTVRRSRRESQAAKDDGDKL